MSHKLLRTLLHLAQADGTVSGSELALIYKIGVEKGIPMFEVEQIIQNPPKEAEELSELSENDKFEYLYTIVLMMKMDGILDERESAMCARYADSTWLPGRGGPKFERSNRERSRAKWQQGGT